MRVALLLSVLLLAYTNISHAELGGFPEQFNTEGTTVVSSASLISTASSAFTCG